MSIQINGATGIYNGIIQNNSVRYGRNAVSNVNEHLMGINSALAQPAQDTFEIGDSNKYSDAEIAALMTKMEEGYGEIPNPEDLEYAYQYMPTSENGKVDPMALLGSAFEELGKNISVGVKDFTQFLKSAFGQNVTAESFDLNEDGLIDTAEYASTMLVQDMLSTDSSEINPNNINGIISTEGETASLGLINEDNIDEAKQIFQTVYNKYDLGNAQKSFLADENNLV